MCSKWSNNFYTHTHVDACRVKRALVGDAGVANGIREAAVGQQAPPTWEGGRGQQAPPTWEGGRGLVISL